MSFDDIFNYGPALARIAEERADAAGKLSAAEAEKTLLTQAVDYLADEQVVLRIDELDTEISLANRAIARYDAVAAEIAVVQGLPSGVKEDLVYFYGVVGAQKLDFMARTLFNHTQAVNSAKIAALRADTITSAESRTAVAKVYYASYTFPPEYLRAIVLIFTSPPQ